MKIRKKLGWDEYIVKHAGTSFAFKGYMFSKGFLFTNRNGIYQYEAKIRDKPKYTGSQYSRIEWLTVNLHWCRENGFCECRIAHLTLGGWFFYTKSKAQKRIMKSLTRKLERLPTSTEYRRHR